MRYLVADDQSRSRWVETSGPYQAAMEWVKYSADPAAFDGVRIDVRAGGNVWSYRMKVTTSVVIAVVRCRGSETDQI